ncbi:GyrI-like domain-containing protein [Microbacterium oxydans]|uniref:GyrI-like domain-containing protein n=1 Tax=Microbacterium oxydans TaxID=82380 RepID=UPI003638762F
MNDSIEYTPVDGITVYATHRIIAGGDPDNIMAAIPALIERLDDALEAAGRPLIEPGIFWYVPIEGSDDIDVHVSYTAEEEAVSGDGYDVTRLPAVDAMARLRHQGDMTTINESWGMLMQQLVTDGYAMSGPSREVYIDAPGHIPTADWITELQVPVERRASS